MTKAQERTIEAIKNRVAEFDFYGRPEQYEIKRWEVTEEHGIVCLVFETGMKNDEGTMASILCRKKRQVFISPKGSITVYMWNQKLHRLITHKYVSVFALMNRYWEH